MASNAAPKKSCTALTILKYYFYIFKVYFCVPTTDSLMDEEVVALLHMRAENNPSEPI
jgi:hypothetical protein